MNKISGTLGEGEFERVDCDSCVLGKQTKMPHPSTGFRSARVLDLIHSDVCSAGEVSYNGKEYFVTFTHDWSRFSITYLIERKSEVLGCFKVF